MINTLLNGEYELYLPEFRAERPEWSTDYGWEKARIKEMVALIEQKDLVFYIGAECGDIAAILAKYTKCSMALCEPNDRVFPTIKSIWQANELPAPVDFFRGFFSNKSTITEYKTNADFFDIDTTKMIPDSGFKQLYENYPDVPQLTLDDYCKFTGLIPDIITMDVEGSEFRVVKGAELLLKEHKPVIFMSVHEVFMWESYKEEKGVMLKYMKDLGYSWDCISYDIHENHVVFYDK